MCGIGGVLGLALEQARPVAERMRSALAHRGPDDSGLAVVEGPPNFPQAVLVHTRLSIVDLSPAGHQPMRDRPEGSKAPNVITFNGEIYNYRALQPELAANGWPCRTGSDTEALLNAYRVFGIRAVERMEGMFAFCLLDPEQGSAWLCRDRIGMKPLYLYRPAGGGLLFASEVRALLAAGEELVPRRLRRGALESYLAQGAVMSDEAIVEGVSMLEAGASLCCDFAGRPQKHSRYWAVAFGSTAGAELAPADGSLGSPPWVAAQADGPWRSELVANLKASLRRSVSRLLLADVPVGLFLSSGVDSGVLATVASEVSTHELHTLAVGFDVQELDETLAAGLTARDLGTRHERIIVSGEGVLSSFDDVLASVDQPTVDGFNTYYVARAARQAGLTVALSGVGGDELFGGYHSFRDVPRAFRVRRVAELLGRRGTGVTARMLDVAAGMPLFATRGRALQKLGESLRRPLDVVELYLLRRELFTRTERRALHPLPDRSDPLSGLDAELVSRLKATHPDSAPLDRIGELEFSVYMRHMLLRDADVFGMKHALEIRLPLLEHYAVAEAASARAAWRLPDSRPKPLLVDAAGERLPARAWQGKKRGFTFPWRAWLNGPLKQRAEAGLASEALRQVGFERRAIDAIWRGFLAGDPRVNELEIIALLVLEAYVGAQRLSA